MIFRWNLLILIFCSGFDEVTLFSTLELRSTSVNNWLEAISVLIALLSLTLLVTLICIATYIAIKF